MAATAATALQFSYLQSRATPHPPTSLPLASLRRLRFTPSRSWRLPRTLAAIAQEDASGATNAPVEGIVEEEPASPQASSETKLYFGNLPYNCDSSQLASIVQEYAPPEMVEVLYDRESGKSRGFAFVTMSTIADCEEVIKNLDAIEYGGRVMRVNFANRPNDKREPLYPESEFKLFVGNLPWAATSESLQKLFEECGNVVGARVLYDGDTGKSRGYGFVSYSTKDEMDAAIDSLDGVELEGRPMRISVALGKRSRA